MTRYRKKLLTIGPGDAIISEHPRYARVVELADSLDSGSSVHYARAGSSPASRTKRALKRKVSTLFFRDQLPLRLRSARRPGLPDGQHAEPVPFQVMVHGYSGKPGFGEERGKLPAAENAQAVNNGLPPAVAVLQAASASCPDLTRLHGHDSCWLPCTCPESLPACVYCEEKIAKVP